MERNDRHSETAHGTILQARRSSIGFGRGRRRTRLFLFLPAGLRRRVHPRFLGWNHMQDIDIVFAGRSPCAIRLLYCTVGVYCWKTCRTCTFTSDVLFRRHIHRRHGFFHRSKAAYRRTARSRRLCPCRSKRITRTRRGNYASSDLRSACATCRR